MHACQQDSRYIEATLPELPFKDNEFDLALCSHLLFLYSEQLSLEFHLSSLHELVRVASEVRVFPLQELGAVKSRHLDGALAEFTSGPCNAEVVPVPYEFQKGGNKMLKITRR